MEAKFIKRLLSYLIDILILGIVLVIACKIVPENNNIKKENIKLDDLNEQFLNHEISTFNYVNEYSKITQKSDKDKIIYIIVNIIFVVFYFIIIPYFFNGQTLGKRLIKIKVDKEEGSLELKDLIIRNIIINGLALMIIGLITLYIMPALIYFIITTILSIVQIIIIIASVIMIIKDEKHLGIHDKVTKTKVINVEKNHKLILNV